MKFGPDKPVSEMTPEEKIELIQARLADELAGVEAFRSMTIEELRDWLLRRKGKADDGRVEQAEAILEAKIDYRDANLASRADKRATLALVVSGIATVAAVVGLVVRF